MAELTYTGLVDAEHLRSHVGPPHPARASAKYRKSRRGDKEADERFAGKKIARGTRLIIREMSPKQRGQVFGYMLATVIDTENVARGWWGEESKFIVEVTDVSRPDLKSHIGRLRQVTTSDYSWFGGREIREVGKANWVRHYKVTE